MTIYNLALFLHILGAFGLIASLAVEAVALSGLRSATEAAQARSSLQAFRWLRIMGPASIALILVMGLYLMASVWGWRGWIVSGLVGLLVIGLVGGLVNGTRMAKIGPMVGRAQGELSQEMRRTLHDPALLISSRVRIALVLGVLFLMSVKPSTLLSLATLLLGAALGLLAAQLGGSPIRREVQARQS